MVKVPNEEPRCSATSQEESGGRDGRIHDVGALSGVFRGVGDALIRPDFPEYSNIPVPAGICLRLFTRWPSRQLQGAIAHGPDNNRSLLNSLWSMEIRWNREAARKFTIYQHLVRCPVLYPDRYVSCRNRFILAILIFFVMALNVVGLGFPKAPDNTYLKITLTSDTIVSTYQADGCNQDVNCLVIARRPTLK
jgi:hypothetical protein